MKILKYFSFPDSHRAKFIRKLIDEQYFVNRVPCFNIKKLLVVYDKSGMQARDANPTQKITTYIVLFS